MIFKEFIHNKRPSRLCRAGGEEGKEAWSSIPDPSCLVQPSFDREPCVVAGMACNAPNFRERDMA